MILCLSKGVYEFNANTGIYKISENCNIHMNIDDLNEKEVCEHVSINLFKKNIKKDISFMLMVN